jgi:hypothetical protein
MSSEALLEELVVAHLFRKRKAKGKSGSLRKEWLERKNGQTWQRVCVTV